MNRKWQLGVGFALCLAGAAIWSYSIRTDSTSASGLIVTPEVVEVQRGESDTAYASVELKNSGSQTIHIKKLETSCHCTTVDAIEQMDLVPGQSTTVKLKLQLPSFDKQETSVMVYSDSLITPQIRIPIKMRGAEIHPPFFRQTPSEVRLQMESKDDRTIEFEVLTVESPGEPWMTGFESTNAGFSVASCESSVATKYSETAILRSYHCVLDVSQFTPGETLRGTLRPRCRNESMKPIPTIQATISSTATAKVIPAQLFISQKSRQTLPLQRTIVIETANNTANPVREVTASVEWIQMERILGADTHPAYRITIAPPADLPVDIGAEVMFHLTDTSLLSMIVPLVFE